MAWFKDNLIALIAGGLALLGATGAAFYFRKKSLDERGRRRIVEAESKYQRLRGQRDEVSRSAEAHEQVIKEIDDEIMETKTEMVKTIHRIDRMSSGDVVREFNRLYGFGS